jgi:hypothetical protein
MSEAVPVFRLCAFMRRCGSEFTNRIEIIFILLRNLHRTAVPKTEDSKDVIPGTYFINLGNNISCIVRHVAYYDLFTGKYIIIILYFLFKIISNFPPNYARKFKCFRRC